MLSASLLVFLPLFSSDLGGQNRYTLFLGLITFFNCRTKANYLLFCGAKFQQWLVVSKYSQKWIFLPPKVQHKTSTSESENIFLWVFFRQHGFLCGFLYFIFFLCYFCWDFRILHYLMTVKQPHFPL